MSTYYRAQAQRCLALSRAAYGKQRVQLLLMANRYFERAEELEQAVRFKTRHHHYEEARSA
jgi:hypothetical protein